MARFRAPGTKIQLFTAKFSPDESWIGLTVRREASFSLGERAFLVERSTGRRLELGDSLVGPLRFHPTRREVFGLVWSTATGGGRLVRWTY